MEKKCNVSLKEYSYILCGGEAREMFFPETEDEVLEILKKRNEIFVIGKGSNVLFSDGMVEKTLINLKKMNKIKSIGDLTVRVQSGLRFINLINYMKKNNYTGLEKIAGIPGTVGGLSYMNAGAYGVEIFDCIERIRFVDEKFEIRELKKEDINHSYRTSEIKEKSWIVLEIEFKFEKGFKIKEVYERLMSRKEKQPLNYPNLGSIFKNPKGFYAGQLIEELGLKGFGVGGAKISEKHANFIINYDNAKSADVIELIRYIKEKVKKVYNIDLEEEIILVK